MVWTYSEGYEEELQRLKDERPDCDESEDGDHAWIEYGGDGTKVCADCHYTENIVIPR